MKKYSIYFGLVASWLIFTACPEDNPPVPNRDTTIHLYEVSTEIFSTRLEVSVEDSSDSWMFELTRDDSTILISEVFNSDTTIKDNALSNVTQYNYQAYWLKDGERADSSETVTITTGDTTSHNFIWEIDTLGEYGSYLNDVAIVDENNIWVVGNIETDSTTYNAAHWDGSEWEMIRIIISAALNSIFYFSEDDIWVLGSWPFHWDGSEWTMYHLENMGIILGGLGGEIWGTSSSNMYFVGRYGRIVHYDGTTFTKMESGTDVDLLDVDGTVDGGHVFVRGYDENIPSKNIVLENSGNQWNTIYYIVGHYFPESGDYGHIEGIGVFRDTLYVSTVAGFWKYNYTKSSSILIPDHITKMGNGAFTDIHITANNDMYFDGAGFKYIHYNGNTYYYGQEIYDIYPQRANLGSDYNGSLVVVVGYFNWWEGALVAKGLRIAN